MHCVLLGVSKKTLWRVLEIPEKHIGYNSAVEFIKAKRLLKNAYGTSPPDLGLPWSHTTGEAREGMAEEGKGATRSEARITLFDFVSCLSFVSLFSSYPCSKINIFILMYQKCCNSRHS